MKFLSKYALLSNKKVTFVYQDKGDFFNDVCLSANDVDIANDDGFAIDVWLRHIL